MKKKIKKLIRQEVKRQIQEVLDPERFCVNCVHAEVTLPNHYACVKMRSKPRGVRKKDWCMYWERQ